MIIDELFKDRVSDYLTKRILDDVLQGRGFFSRGVLESIRFLEGLNVAPSTVAMKLQERELKGRLAGFHHVHVSEDNFTRAFNAYRGLGEHPEKSPTAEALIERANKVALKKYLILKGVKVDGCSFDEMVDKLNIIASENGVQETQRELSLIIRELVSSPFNGVDKISGDWLIYFIGEDGTRFYLDSCEHISAQDLDKQNGMSLHLHALLATMKSVN